MTWQEIFRGIASDLGIIISQDPWEQVQDILIDPNS